MLAIVLTTLAITFAWLPTAYTLAPTSPAITCANRTDSFRRFYPDAQELLFDVATLATYNLTNDCSPYSIRDYADQLAPVYTTHRRIPAHIVDPARLAIASCSPNIRANSLMMYDDWVSELEAGAAYSEYEKFEVLGAIYARALRAVAACCANSTVGILYPDLRAVADNPTMLCVATAGQSSANDPDSSDVVFLAIAITFICTTAMLIAGFMVWCGCGMQLRQSPQMQRE